MQQVVNQIESYLDYLSTISRAKNFLGREFLTWLWFKSETENFPLTLANIRSPKQKFFVEFWVDNKIILESHLEANHEYSLKGGDPSKSAEAHMSLISGKTIKELRLGLRVDEQHEYFCNLTYANLSPKSLKLPIPGERVTFSGEEDLLNYRLRHVEIFLAILDSLFGKFLDQRVNENWENQGLKDIQTWLKKRFALKDKVLH